MLQTASSPSDLLLFAPHARGLPSPGVGMRMHDTLHKNQRIQTVLVAKRIGSTNGLLGARTLLGAPGIATRNKKLLGARTLLG